MPTPSERASDKQATTTHLLSEFKRLIKSEALLRQSPCTETALGWLRAVRWAANDIFRWMADDIGRHQPRAHADASVAEIIGAIEWHFMKDGLSFDCRLAKLCTQARKYEVVVQVIDFDIPGDDAHRHFAFPSAYETVTHTLDHLTNYWFVLACRKFGAERVLVPKKWRGLRAVDRPGLSIAAHSFKVIPAIRESIPAMNWNHAAAERLLVQFEEEIRQVEGFLWNLPPESQSSLFSKLFPRSDDAETTSASGQSEGGSRSDAKALATPPPSGAVDSGYLGLWINEQTKEVSRPAVSEIDVPMSEAQFRLVVAMTNAGSEGIATGAAHNIRGGKRSADRQFKTSLNHCLSTLLVKIKEREWRIVETDETSA